jgi:hypothetical protein
VRKTPLPTAVVRGLAGMAIYVLAHELVRPESPGVRLMPFADVLVGPVMAAASPETFAKRAFAEVMQPSGSAALFTSSSAWVPIIP